MRPPYTVFPAFALLMVRHLRSSKVPSVFVFLP